MRTLGRSADDVRRTGCDVAAAGEEVYGARVLDLYTCERKINN